jgi:hypothetical protein
MQLVGLVGDRRFLGILVMIFWGIFTFLGQNSLIATWTMLLIPLPFRF